MTISDAALVLECSKQNFYVTASVYKKKFGAYPCWYKSDGVSGRKDSVDIDVKWILNLRQEVFDLYIESGDLYFNAIEKYGTMTAIAHKLVELSTWGSSFQSWMSFMNRDLFKEPTVSFEDRHHKLREFNRIMKEIL